MSARKLFSNAMRCYILQGKIGLMGTDGKMDSEYYTSVLRKSLIPVADALYGEEWILQQDNALVYSVFRTAYFFG